MDVRHLGALLLLCVVVACRGEDTRPRPTLTPAPTPTASPTAPLTPTPPPDPFALAKRYDSSSPSQLAEKLSVAERAVRDIETRDDALAEQARVQQAAYRQLVREPAWRDDVYAMLPDGLRRPATLNVEAGADLRALTQPRTELPPWLIVDPPAAAELRGHYDAAAEEFRMDWTYLAAIHLVETRMGRIRGTSTAGAKGPMQFLPQTWDAYGEGDIEDPRDAIRAAARYLDAHGGPEDMGRALYAYNHSDRYVRAVSNYASLMRDDPNVYRAYYNWDVYYRTTRGDALLYVGWPSK